MSVSHKVVQWRRGTSAQHETFVGAVGEVTVDIDKDVVVVHDGVTPGGHPMRRDDTLINRRYFVSFRAGVVQNGQVGLGFSTVGPAPTPLQIVTPTGVATAVARFSPLLQQSVQGNFSMPFRWSGTPLFSTIVWRTTLEDFPVAWFLDYGGLDVGDTIDTFQFAHTIAFPLTVPTNGVLHQTTVELTDLTGISATSEIYFRLRRGIDSCLGHADLLSMRLSYEREDV